MTLGERYYHIAIDDINYLMAAHAEGYYNQPTSLCQQIAEKLLKSIVADYYTEDDLEDVLRSHSLKRIALAASKTEGTDHFDKKALAYLSDFYFDARYPGPDYVKVDKETYEECVSIMYSCKAEVDEMLKRLKKDAANS
jgi:HEPN domain-containing protein